MMDVKWIQVGLTGLFLLLGVAANYGAFKRRLDEHDEKFKSVDEDQKVQDQRLSQHDTHIGRIQGRLGIKTEF